MIGLLLRVYDQITRKDRDPPSATFVKATVEDMPAAVALADEVFGGRNTIPVEKRMTWLRKNPEIDYLLKQGDQLVGYLSLRGIVIRHIVAHSSQHQKT